MTAAGSRDKVGMVPRRSTDRRTTPPLAAAEMIERASGLDPVGDALTGAIRGVLPAGRTKDLLSGTWLGHALHPLLTDIPIGAWTSSVVLDWIGGRKARPAADTLIALGILAADSRQPDGRRRLGRHPAEGASRRAGPRRREYRRARPLQLLAAPAAARPPRSAAGR